MSLICFLTIASGVLFSKILLGFDLSIPALRYSLSVLFSYVAFFLLVYLWLRWQFGAPTRRRYDESLDVIDVLDAVETPSLNMPEAKWTGSGGGFSGGGSSGSWADSSSSLGEDAASSVGDIDEAIVLVILVAVIAAISGSTLYVVYYAPEILFEAAFEVVLAAGLLRKTKNIQAEGWAYSIFKRTWKPFAIALIAALVFGLAMKSYCPGAASFEEFRALCWTSSTN